MEENQDVETRKDGTGKREDGKVTGRRMMMDSGTLLYPGPVGCCVSRSRDSRTLYTTVRPPLAFAGCRHSSFGQTRLNLWLLDVSTDSKTTSMLLYSFSISFTGHALSLRGPRTAQNALYQLPRQLRRRSTACQVAGIIACP